jgi:hypothetical protein
VARRHTLALAGLLTLSAIAAPAGQFTDLAADLVREAAIAYFTTPAADRVARLNADLQRGAATLTFDPVYGYLPSVLQALGVPASSQLLLFTKSSVQAPRINPRNPRAIYFDDSVSLGFIHGAEFLEFAAQDPRQGIVFYTLDQRAVEKPAIERRDYCLSCHNNRATLEVPGLLVRSIATTATGAPVPKYGNSTPDHRTPFDDRWSGYYVTGRHGPLQHLGNAMLVDRTSEARVTTETLNLDSVTDRVDVEHYLSPHSDIAALLVFEHQMHMANLLTRIGWDARVLATYPRKEKTGENAKTAENWFSAISARSAVFSEPLHDMVTELVDYLLFVDEAPLPAAVTGTSGFAAQFGGRGPADRRGRSLRQLDLETRLLRYPCSYMIYSDAFDALPPPARDAVYARMWRVLSGQDAAPKYARLSTADRRAIVEILRDTKPALPAYFSSADFR